jgi:hypothetical protein
MGELIQGPVQPWQPSEADLALVASLLASKDEIDNAFGEAYAEGCFVGGINGLAAVGKIDAINEAEFRVGKPLDPQAMSLDALIKLGAFPGRGKTRAEQIRDGVRRVLEARGES